MTSRVRLRPIAGSIVRGGLSLLARIGLANQLIRNARYDVIGVQWKWGKDEPIVTRGLIVERQMDEVPVKFFVADENDHIQQHHMWGQWYEHAELDLIAQHFDGGTFVDVGANVGNHTLYAALVMNAAKVLAFEPNPPAFKACSYNILLNDLAGRVQLFNCGLSDLAGQAHVTLSPDRNLGGTKLEIGTGSLTLMRGDDVLYAENPSFIKIDVETLELRVLGGLHETIARCRPTLFVEVDTGNDAAFNIFLDNVDYEAIYTRRMPENTNYLCRPRSPMQSPDHLEA